MIFFLSVLQSSCSPQLISRKLDSFTAVDIAAFGELEDVTNVKATVNFVQQDTFLMDIQKSTQDSIRWYVKKDTLYVLILNSKSPKLTIHAPHYKSIRCLNVNKIEIKDTLRQSSLNMYSAGAETALISLNVDTLDLYMDIFKKVKLFGHCDTASIQAEFCHAFANFDASKFIVNNMQISCGTANAHTSLNVLKHLWIIDALNSRIDYTGNPDIMQANLHYTTLRGN